MGSFPNFSSFRIRHCALGLFGNNTNQIVEYLPMQFSLTKLMTFPIYPMLFIWWMWLSIFSTNYNQVSLSEVYRSAFFTFIIGVGFLLCIKLLNPQKRDKAGAILLLVILCLTLYGNSYEAMNNISPVRVRDLIFVPIWCLVFAFPIVILLFTKLASRELTIILNSGAFVLLILPVFGILMREVNSLQDVSIKVPVVTLPEPTSSTSANYPDIYFLIFDRYASQKTLKKVYGFDNSKFLKKLSDKGFYIVRESRANYTKTAHSLAATLNMQHLTEIWPQPRKASDEWQPLYKMTNYNVVTSILKSKQYFYSHFGSWWQPTRNNPRADYSFQVEVISWANEFETVLLEPLLVTRILNYVLGRPPNARDAQYLRVNEKFKQLGEIQDRKEPNFVFAHMLTPHDPYVFYPDGGFKSANEAARMPEIENYRDQIIYTNYKILELVDILLARSPQPIIILQADEGPFPKNYRLSKKSKEVFDWKTATPDEFQQKFGILNAIYFPDRDYQRFYDAITPINTFPVIFNKYFEMNIKLLEDRSYSIRSDKDIYSFFDVTRQTQ